MATEPTTVDSSADVSAPSSTSKNINDSQNVSPDTSAVNGSPNVDEVQNKRITSVEEQANSADPSVSGGSDTEASRGPDGLKDKDGDKGHVRAGSTVKKTFKAVSVNKKFLATKSSGSASPGLGEKGLSSSTPPPGSGTLSARPRLVAKAGSGTGNSLGRSTSGVNGAKASNAPDPSTVWNRNQPPEPKKYTDEELKKYGIHMASRINETDAAGQKGWGDIDDDDDDWAPDTITWGDGTKTTLDEQPPAPPTPQITIAPVATATAPATTAPNAAPVAKPEDKKPEEKPRSPAPVTQPPPPTKSSGLAAGRGLVLKPASQEKPTLVAKPPAPPQPVKSPWATLPQVERMSPVPTAVEPAQQPRGPPGQSYRDMSQAAMAQHAPREIAADDFSRSSYRDGPYQGRELFNSHSGQYEPVDRRNSMRQDPQARHPAVLQRSHGNDHPAEPSSAFQTHRTGQEHSFGRRRTSSIHSGGSGAYFQRSAKGGDSVPLDAPHARRPSMAGSHDSPVAAHAQPAVNNNQHGAPSAASQQGMSPQQQQAVPQQQQPVAPQPGPDDYEIQQKIMREAREAARKRRQEEEEKQEAERKERIRKKLDAMGPPPEKKSEKKEKEAQPKPTSVKPTQIQQREQKDTKEPKDASQQIAEAINQLHQAKPDTAVLPNEEPITSKARRPSTNNGPVQPTGPRRMSHGQDAKRPDIWTGAGAAPRAERFAGWAPGNGPPPSHPVWGAPNNNRGLGNGTFNTDLGRLPDAAGPTQPGSSPSPIGPPSAARPAADSRAAPAPPPPGTIGLRSSRFASSGSELANKWVNAVADSDKKLTVERRVERAQREAQLAERGISLEEAQPQIKDTWRQVHAPGDGTRRAVGPLDGMPLQPPQNPAGVIGSGPKNSSILPQGAQRTPPQNRPSRFFPANQPQADRHDAHATGRSQSPSPPPPTMEGHPAYEGDAMHPHVLLPRPQPKVRLPPSVTAAPPPPPPSTAPSQPFSWANPGSFSQALRGPPPPPAGQAPVDPKARSNNADWQNRFNSLLHISKVGSPPKATSVDPASRNALDQTVHQDLATVSLPGKAPVTRSLTNNAQSAITKPMAEECFEEQEMGSLPQIRIPHEAPEAAWHPADEQFKPLPRRFTVDATNKDSYYFKSEIVSGVAMMRISFPGAREAKTVTAPVSSATRGSRGGRPGPRSRGSGRGGKRDASAAHLDREPSHDGSATRGSGRGRGGYRGRGSENWGRQPSASQPSIST